MGTNQNIFRRYGSFFSQTFRLQGCLQIHIKSDGCYLTSNNHPNLDKIEAPKTKKGMKGSALMRQNKNSRTTSTPAKKSKSTVNKILSKEGVAQFMINNNIRTEAELMSEAKKREKAGKPDLWS